MRLRKINNTYHVCFNAEDGTPMSVDTGCEDYKEAKAIAWKSKAKELEQVAKATRLTAEIVSRIVSGKELKIEEALGQYAVWASKNLVKRTADSHISYAKKWAKEMDLEIKPPSAVEDSDVFDWINSSENIKASTRRVRKAAVKSFLDFCLNKGWMLSRPADNCKIRMDNLKHTQKETKSHKSMNVEDIKALMKVADPFWAMAIFLAANTGLRLGDICSLEWSCFDGNTINVWTDKTNKRVSINLPSDVINNLCNLPVSNPDYVFPDKREIYLDVSRRAGLSVSFKRLCKKAAGESGRSSLLGKSFHGLRSYYAKNKKGGGSSIKQIAKDLGHSNTKTTEVYLK